MAPAGILSNQGPRSVLSDCQRAGPQIRAPLSANVRGPADNAGNLPRTSKLGAGKAPTLSSCVRIRDLNQFYSIIRFIFCGLKL